MPPAKKATGKATKAVRKATKPTTQRRLTSAHKQALAEGRTMSATVDRYLAAVNTPKRRGRKVSMATLEVRLAAAHEILRSATGVEKVLAAQKIRDLETQIASLNVIGQSDIKSLEAAFVKIAKRFGENRGITYGAWRDGGVPADVLKRAGVARTRG